MAGITGAVFEKEGIKAETRAAQTQAEFNRQQAVVNEQLALEQAEEESTLIREQGKRDVSSAIASQAASGLITTTGSPALVQLDIAFEAEKAALTRLRSGTIEAQGFESEQSFRSFESDLATTRGRTSRRASLLSGIATDVQLGTQLFGATK